MAKRKSSEFLMWCGMREKDAAFAAGLPPALEPFLDSFWAGKALKNPPSSVSLTLPPRRRGRFTDEFPVLDYHCVLLRPRVVELLRKAGVTKLEEIRCTIDSEEYVAVVLRDVVACFDRGRAKFEETIAVDESKAQGHLLFRMAKPGCVAVCHRSIADAIQSAKFSGIQFLPLDGSCDRPAMVDQAGGEFPPGWDD